MQPAKIQEIRTWLTKALQDLRSAEWLLTSPDQLYSAVGFHSQPATTLTPYAVTFRYPGDLPELSLEEAGQAVTLARQVWEFVLPQLPSDTHPGGNAQ